MVLLAMLLGVRPGIDNDNWLYFGVPVVFGGMSLALLEVFVWYRLRGREMDPQERRRMRIALFIMGPTAIVWLIFGLIANG
jgi:hypothetical protein